MSQGAPRIVSELIIQKDEEEIDIMSVSDEKDKTSILSTTSSEPLLTEVSSTLYQKAKTEKKSRSAPYTQRPPKTKKK